MANKRPPLELHDLTEHLKTSQGRGAEAFYSNDPLPPDTTNNITSNITLLQITQRDIDELRELAEKPQTYRLTHKNIEYIKDMAYTLSKQSKRGKIGQGDILRIALLLFDKFITSNKADLKIILERIK